MTQIADTGARSAHVREFESGVGSPSKAARWTAYVLSGLVVAFLLFDAIVKLIMIPAVVEGSQKLGYPPETMPGIGWVLLLCTMLYVIPRTSVLGAILLTGYLGGAVATHVRVGDPLFSHVLFPVYVGVLAWAGLLLREDRIRELVPLRR